MKTRTSFIVSLIAVVIVAAPVLFFGLNDSDHTQSVRGVTEFPPPSKSTQDQFEILTSQAKEHDWYRLSMPELMTKIAIHFLDTPYEAGTLENPTYEQCRFTFDGFDCVTYYEAVLCIARIVKLQKYDLKDLLAQIELTRYRSGKMTDYTSRLHYTSEWISDNQKKGIVTDISTELGANTHVNDVYFMSENPEKYPALVEHPDLVPIIAEFEKSINSNKRHFIRQDDIESVYPMLQNCDIVCLATSIPGLDYAHTGFVHFDKAGNCRLLHASTKHGVYLDTNLADYVRSKKFFTGISIARPNSPSTTVNR